LITYTVNWRALLVGIVSDSHDNLKVVEKAVPMLRRSGIDLLIHLGDIISPFTLLKFLQIECRVLILIGNNDGDLLSLREVAHKAGATLRHYSHVVEVDGFKVLLMHGQGSAEQTLEIVNSLARSQSFDVVMYGHTHKIDIRTVGKCLVINPGELCGYLTGNSTLALFDTSTKKVEIISIE